MRKSQNELNELSQENFRQQPESINFQRTTILFIALQERQYLNSQIISKKVSTNTLKLKKIANLESKVEKLHKSCENLKNIIGSLENQGDNLMELE